MKKQILTVAVAALALAACSKNETVEVASNRAIGFDAFAGNITRADIDEENPLTEFYVFGGYGDGSTAFTGTPNVFNNVKVSKVSNESTEFATEITQYWIANKTYSFAAYSDGNAKLKNNVTFNDGAFAITGYSAGDKDLIYAEPADVPTGGDVTSQTAVGLEFKHLLSKVKFTFTTDVADGNYIEISDLTFNVPNTADYTAASGWTTPSNSDPKSLTVANHVAVNADQESTECYVIPQENANLTVSFTATLKDDQGTTIVEQKFANCPLASGDLSTSEAGNNAWVSGFGYNYTANVSEEEMGADDNVIKFTVTSVANWKDTDVTGDIATK